MKLSFVPTVLAAALVVAGAALAQSPHAGHATEADRALMTVMERMGEAMKAPMSGDPDRDFAAMMIPHHRGAIEMAEIQLRYGKDPELAAMAREIIAAQRAEIATLERWLAEKGR
jgi:uncharacterized protein (DUF305 family)